MGLLAVESLVESRHLGDPLVGLRSPWVGFRHVHQPSGFQYGERFSVGDFHVMHPLLRIPDDQVALVVQRVISSCSDDSTRDGLVVQGGVESSNG